MPKKQKKRSGTQKKSKKPVPDTVVLLPDSMLKKYKNVNKNKNVNVNIIQNKISVPAPKKARRRTARAVKTGNVRVQGPGMLFSSPPITIQTPSYGTPPYPIQPVSSRPVIPGMYDDPDRHRISIVSDTKANPIIGNVNPNNIEPVNNQVRLVPTGITVGRVPSMEYQTPNDITVGLDKVLGNINPFAGLNTARADMLPMASEPYEQPAPEYMGPDPGLQDPEEQPEEQYEEQPEEQMSTSSSQPAVSSTMISEVVPPYISKSGVEYPETIQFKGPPGWKLPPPPSGYLYTDASAGKPRIISSGKWIASNDQGEPIIRKKYSRK